MFAPTPSAVFCIGPTDLVWWGTSLLRTPRPLGATPSRGRSLADERLALQFGPPELFATAEALAVLDRVLEPEVMDTVAEAVDYDAMDHAEVNRRFVDDLLTALAGTEPAAAGQTCRLLDLGTGTAQIPIALVRRARETGFAAKLEIAAIDLAAEMLVLAKRNVLEAGMLDVIRLERLDAKTLPYRPNRFSVVASNSIVHHIPDPREALEEAVRVTAPGGLLFFRDLLRPSDEAELARWVELHTVGANDHQRQLFAQSLRAALTVREVQELVASLGFEPSTVKATSDRHWTWEGWKS